MNISYYIYVLSLTSILSYLIISPVRLPQLNVRLVLVLSIILIIYQTNTEKIQILTTTKCELESIFIDTMAQP